MNIHQLRFIRSTVRHNFNLSEAAKALFTSQPGLSKAILTFEQELGVQIFLRQGKRLRGLTDIGIQVVVHIENILNQIEHIKKISADHTTKHEGVLRIATTHTQARYTLPKIIAQFTKEYPRVKVSISQGSPAQIINFVKDGLADIAIATEINENIPDWDVSIAFEWQHVLIAPKNHEIFNHGQNKNITIQDLAKYSIITYNKAFSGRKKIDETFEANDIMPDIVLEAVDADVIKTYVELGMGVGIMAEVAYDAQKDNTLQIENLGHLFGKQSVKIAYRHNVYQRDFTYGFIRLLSFNE